MYQNLLFLFIVSLGINLVMFLVAYKYQTDKLTDASYSITFIALSSWIFFQLSSRNVTDTIIYALIFIWAIRLGYYLFKRIQVTGRDDRFDEIRTSFKSFLGFWLVQGVSVFIILLSQFIISQNNNDKISELIVIGIMISIIGFLIESVADHQKFTFKLNNPNDFISTGLWQKIRHPNYLGEILFWLGIFVASIPYSSLTYIAIALISPLWISFLLIKFSGIPPLEEKWMTKYKDNTDFQEYYKRTSRLIPGVY
ncbi:MAG: DUF1295 domain-containing protein [Bacteroidia bacterium]|nr:DUF1295 domain-containing protein [Bacteroidia bacterium]